MVIIEPYSGFIDEIHQELYTIRKNEIDKFMQKDLIQAQVKRLLAYGVNISKDDIKKFKTPIGEIKTLYEMIYLPHGAIEYSSDYGIKKSDEINIDDSFF